MSTTDPISLALILGLLALVPITVVATTSFVKLAVVLTLVRNAMGVQQVPPNIALYGLALILTVYIMAPIGSRIYDNAIAIPDSDKSIPAMISSFRESAEPLRGFLERNSRQAQRDFFLRTSQRLWGPELSRGIKANDYIILIPAFLVTELSSAFEIGFLLFLPFVVIDLIVSNILLSMGMMMVSPVTISLPFKLFLFVAIDGWSRLIGGLVLTYAVN
jgi:type III secretion protein R